MSLDWLNSAVAFLSLLVALVALLRQRHAADRMSKLKEAVDRQELRNRRIEATQLQADLLFRVNAILMKYMHLAERADSISTSPESPSADLLSVKLALRSRISDFTKASDDVQQALSVLSDHEQLAEKDLEHFDQTCASLRMANSAIEKNGTDAMIDEFARRLAQFETTAA